MTSVSLKAVFRKWNMQTSKPPIGKTKRRKKEKKKSHIVIFSVEYSVEQPLFVNSLI